MNFLKPVMEEAPLPDEAKAIEVYLRRNSAKLSHTSAYSGGTGMRWR